MKKNLFKFGLAMIFTLLGGCFISCSNDSGSSSDECKITVSVVNAPSSIETCTFWSWEDGGGNYTGSNWNTDRAVMTKSTEDNIVIWSYTYAVKSNSGVGVVFVNKTSDSVRFPADGDDLIIPASEIYNGAKLYISWGDKTVYKSAAECSGLQSAEVTSNDAKTVTLKIFNAASASKSDFTVQDRDGNPVSIDNVNISSSSGTITLGSEADLKKLPYSITFGEKTVTASLSLDLIDDVYDATSITDFGVTLNNENSATFKTWAPLAKNVKLVLYSDSDAKNKVSEKDMQIAPSGNGVWIYSGSYDDAKYYQYYIENPSSANYVSDIWHTIAGPDSKTSKIAEINESSTKPAGWEEKYTNPWKGTSYSEAVIYEMHIRDWSRAAVTDSTGKFLDIANSTKIIDHLKDLGITHVQILPMFDYAQKNDDPNYNWGYNPYHYNVPEGRYVTKDYTDGSQAVKEMRTMIKALHEAGIAVNMDVVYNHTSGTGSSSLYDMTVPKYFYWMDNNAYMNYSGCGNAINLDRKMVRKYVIDSLKHWMLDYHINGFRFDLMGIHSKEAMKEIYEALSAIDPKVMVYGEPWTGGDKPANTCNSAITAGSYGVGAFDDDFRDAIKGAEFGGFKKGQVQGTYNDTGITSGLKGLSGNNKRNETGIPALALHYVECHDNYTLFDKLAMSYLKKTTYSGDLFAALGEKGLAAVKAQNKLAAAYVFLSQGTAFMNGGQEFLRTKKGNENSYQSDDTINAIDLTFKEKYFDVYNVYKGLIALRKANPSAFGSNTGAKAETVSKGVTKYTTGDFRIFFNATDNEVEIASSEMTGYTKVIDVTSGTPEESTTVPTSVPAKSFVILKK